MRVSSRWLLCFCAAVVIADAVDVTQMSFHFWRTGRSPLDARYLFAWGLGEWLTRAWIVPAAALTVALLPIEGRGHAWRAAAHVAASLLLTPVALALSVAFVLPQFIGPAPAGATWFSSYQWGFMYVTSRYFLPTVAVYWLTVGIIQALSFHNRYSRKARDAAELERRSGELEARLSRARLDALKSRVNPEFISHTLSSITRLAGEGRRRAIVHTTTRLARLLRAVVDEDATVVPLIDELRIVRDYLKIAELRAGSDLMVEWRVDRATLAAEAPQSVLLPLVERVLANGTARSSGKVKLVVGAHLKNERLAVWVEGPLCAGLRGPADDPLMQEIEDRLAHLYGDDHSVHVAATAYRARFEVRVPVPSAIHAGAGAEAS